MTLNPLVTEILSTTDYLFLLSQGRMATIKYDLLHLVADPQM